MKILITGSEGFIGSHLTENLLSRGYKIKAFILYNSFNSKGWLNEINRKYNKNIEFVFGDIRDPALVNNAVKDCDSIFHLASLIGIPYSYKAPFSYYDTNVKGTLNLLDSIKGKKIKKFIHTSTSEVYGTAQYQPIDEKHPLNAQSPYAASKIAADQLVSAYCNSFEIPAITIRPFNTFGPRQSFRAVVPTIISQSLFSKSNKIKLGSLNPTRDFTFIDDTVDGFIKGFKSNKKNGEIYNLGTGNEISIKELALKITNKINPKIKIVNENIRKRPKKSEVMQLISNYEKAKNDLKWQPKYINKRFDEAIDKTIDWYRNRNLLNKNIINYNI